MGDTKEMIFILLEGQIINYQQEAASSALDSNNTHNNDHLSP